MTRVMLLRYAVGSRADVGREPGGDEGRDDGREPGGDGGRDDGRDGGRDDGREPTIRTGAHGRSGGFSTEAHLGRSHGAPPNIFGGGGPGLVEGGSTNAGLPT